MLEKGDYVIINKTENRQSYKQVIGHIGIIKDIKYDRYIDDERYTFVVQMIDNLLVNDYQENGYFIFHNEKSLTKLNELQAKLLLNSIYGTTTLQNMSPVEVMVKINTNQKEVNNMTNNEQGMQPVLQRDMITLYYDKKAANYDTIRHDAIKKVYDNSSVGKIIKNFIKSLTALDIEKEYLPKFDELWIDKYLTAAELKAIDEANNAYNISMSQLCDICTACRSAIMMCETFEQRISVLQKYNVIDIDYQLKL